MRSGIDFWSLPILLGWSIVAFGLQLINADYPITKAFEDQTVVFFVAVEEVGGVQLHSVGASLQHP